MPDRDVSTIRDLIYYQHAKSSQKAPSPPPMGRAGSSTGATRSSMTPSRRSSHLCCRSRSGTADIGDLDGNGETTVGS